MTQPRIDARGRGRLTRAILVCSLAVAGLAAVGQSYSLFCGNHIVDGRQCRYSVNPNCLDAPTPAQQEAAIDAAGATWSLAGSNFTFIDLGTTTRNAISVSDNRQDVFWRDESNGTALAITACNTISVADGADILFYDSGWNWQIGGSLDIQTVALHELGHLLGLNHTGVAGSVMLPNYHGIDRDLGADDRNGLVFIYGASPPPNLISIAPTSGQLRGGETVSLSGVEFAADAVVTFDGVVAPIVSRTGETQIVVESPPGSSVGQTADLRVTQASGSDAIANAYAYVENATDVEIQGDVRNGEIVNVVLFGEPNRRAWVAIGPPGSFTKSGITICATTPFRFRAAPPESTLGPLGERSLPWRVTGAAFEALHVQGAVLRRSGMELTPCVSLIVFP